MCKTMSFSLEHHLIQITDKLRRDFIKVDREWLQDCVDYFLGEEPQIQYGDLYEKVLDQWRLTDLAEIALQCLPNTINTETGLLNLQDNYALQIQYIIDIAESAYEQLRQLYNLQLDQTDNEKQETKAITSKKKRALKMELTDGHIQVIAMEYKPISCLNTKLSPGCKILLTGPLRCINKVILLEPKNIRILGGEVSKYEIENAFENVLLRQLGRPINPNPKTEYAEAVVTEQQPPRQNTVQLQQQFNQPQYNACDDMFGDDDLLLSIDLDVDVNATESNIPTRPAVNAPAIAEPPHSVNLFDDDDDDLIMNEAMLQVAEREHQSSPVKAIEQDIDMIQYEDIDRVPDELEHFQDEAMDIESRKSPPQQISISPHRHSSVELPMKCSILNPKYPFRIRQCNLVTIDQLTEIENDAGKMGKCFIIRAEVDSSFEKLQVKNDAWSIGVFLKDMSEHMLQARITDDVLNTLSDTTAPELQLMRMESKKRPQIREDIIRILGSLKNKLEALNCFMKIQFQTAEEQASSGVAFPMVVGVIDSAPFLEKILANKLNAEDIAQ